MLMKKKILLQQFILCQKLNSRVPFIQLKPILHIFSHCFSLSSHPQLSLKILLPFSLLLINLTVSFQYSMVNSIFHISIQIIRQLDSLGGVRLSSLGMSTTISPIIKALYDR
jgi:hypothetical protein